MSIPSADLTHPPRGRRAVRLRRLAALLATTIVLSVLGAAGLAHPASAEGAGRARKWSDWFAPGREVPRTGDVNGDGRDDLISFIQGSQGTGPTNGDVWVALSTGSSYQPATKWHDWFSLDGETPQVADVNGDRVDDIVTFVQSSAGQGDALGDVWVALSTRSGFATAQKWHEHFSFGAEVPLVGDVDGDGRADLISAVRNAYASTSPSSTGDVWVALSTGTRFGTSVKWQDWFGIGTELLQVGDVDGDRRADLVAFDRTGPGAARGDVWVGRSDGTRFVASKWSESFAVADDIPAVGDLDGDLKADLVAFQVTGTPTTRGDVIAAFSTGTGLGAIRPWHDQFAVGAEKALLADADADGRWDLVRLVGSTQTGIAEGDVHVALTGEATPGPSPAYPAVTAESFGFGAMTSHGRPATGERPLLVVLLDFKDKKFPADRGVDYHRKLFFDGLTDPSTGRTTSVVDYFRQASGGRFTFKPAGPGIVGPVTLPDLPQTPLVDESTLMCRVVSTSCPGSARADAAWFPSLVTLARTAGVNLDGYDTNPKDGTITSAEVQLVVQDSQDGFGGAVRPGNPECASMGTGTLPYCTTTVSFSRQGNAFDTVVHELAHTLGASDLYGADQAYGTANSCNLTLMSCTHRPGSVLLDPWHRMQLGWLRPSIHATTEAGSCSTLLAGNWNRGNGTAVLLYDPRRGTDDFVLLEYRNANDWGQLSIYDGRVPTGLVVWQVSQESTTRTIPGTRLTARPPRLRLVHIAAGDDRVVQSQPAGDDVLRNDGTNPPFIHAGPDHVLQTVIDPRDQPGFQEQLVLSLGASRGAVGGMVPWSKADGPFLVPFADRSSTGVVVQPGAVGNALPGTLQVRWALTSFRATKTTTEIGDPGVRECVDRWSRP